MPREDTQWKPGQSGNPAGKPKGTKNKITAVTKEAVAAVLDQVDPKELLLDWATNKPELFKDLWKHLIPKAVEITGEEGGPIQQEIHDKRPPLTREEWEKKHGLDTSTGTATGGD